MPPPLSDGLVKYAQNAGRDRANDVPETVDQYAKDVTAFLMWAAEPHLVDRKAMGLTVMVFLDHLRRPRLLHEEEGLGDDPRRG